MNDQSWTWNIPTEPGWYWYVEGDTDLYLVKARACHDGMIFVARGRFIFPDEQSSPGAWQKANLPTMPIPDIPMGGE